MLIMHELTNEKIIESPSLQPDARVPGKEFSHTEEFPGGEIVTPSPVELGPIEAVNEFVRHRTASVHEAVLSTVAAAEAIEAFEGDSTKSQQWLGNMVRVKALTKSEASTEGEKISGSNLAKLRKIAKHHKVLSNPRIAGLLPSGGYTIMYQCALLYEDLEMRNAGTAFDELVKIIVGHDGPATRDWLKKEREKRRPTPAKDLEVKLGQAEIPDDRPTYTDSAENAQPTERSESVVQSEVQGVDDGEQTEADQAHHEIDKPSTNGLIAPDSGDGTSEHDSLVKVLRLADSSNDDAVLLIRGSLNVLIAMRIAILKDPGASNVHLFAKSETTGWHPVISDEYWTTDTGGLK
jgi:hypothetical protein